MPLIKLTHAQRSGFAQYAAAGDASKLAEFYEKDIERV